VCVLGDARSVVWGGPALMRCPRRMGGREVVGYYCRATGALSLAQALGKVRRNRPDPVPVMVIGRLAVPAEGQGP